MRHLPHKIPSPKLSSLRTGPYRITKVKSPLVVKLALPLDSRIDNYFHTSLVRPAAKDFSCQQQNKPHPLSFGKDREKYKVDEILESRVRRSQLQYLVKWKGYSEPTWGPESDLLRLSDKLLAKFNNETR